MPEAEIGETPSDLPRGATFFHGGRLEQTKGVRQLLAAFGQVEVSARLVIAGWGELEGAVRAAARRDRRIEFVGRVSRAEVMDLLSTSRALLLPSIWEDNCPLVMLEAQARGTPAIVSDRGGPPEFVVDGEHGFVVDPDDTAAFATCITRLAVDPRLAAAMGARARRRLIDRHNASSHYDGLMTIYREATDSVG
jgi:glycosyltransferase involved in cell wall biosynthesis